MKVLAYRKSKGVGGGHDAHSAAGEPAILRFRASFRSCLATAAPYDDISLVRRRTATATATVGDRRHPAY